MVFAVASISTDAEETRSAVTVATVTMSTTKDESDRRVTRRRLGVAIVGPVVNEFCRQLIQVIARR